MSEGSNKKVYGLIIPKKPSKDKKKTSSTAPAFNVFGDDQDSGEDEKTKGPVGPYGFTKTNSKLKLQSQMDIEKAMMEDPSVYEYDEIYDDIQASKPQFGKPEETKTKKSQRPQYITGLLKAAEEKKKEQERRNERKVQKEREAEGEMYADKEAFVTSAYKQKMLDRQKEEEEEKRKEQIEAMTDVTKQKDLGGFYRYLYRQTTGPEEENKEVKDEIKQEPPDDMEPVKRSSNTSSKRKRSSSSSSSSSTSSRTSHKSDPDVERKSAAKSQDGRTSSQRIFRKRRADSSSSDSEDNDTLRNLKMKDGDKGGRNRNLSEERENRSKHSGSRGGKRDRKSPSPQYRDRGDDRNGGKRKRKSLSLDGREKRDGNVQERRKRRGSPNPRERKDGDTERRRRVSSQSPSPQPSSSQSKSSNSPRLTEESASISLLDTHEISRSNGNGAVDRKHGRSVEDDTKKASAGKHSHSHSLLDKDLSDSADEGDAPAVQLSQNVEKPVVVKKKKETPVEPKDKVYPHHNSPKDIEEARKRYLIRKLEREKARGS